MRCFAFQESSQFCNKFSPRDAYGHCNPCDIKVKTNRFQIFGHTSVEIIMQDDGACSGAVERQNNERCAN